MMSEDVVIRAEGLGKKYLIGHQAEGRQNTLRDTISHGLVNFTRTTRDLMRGKPIIAGDEIEEFWALRDVDFEIRRGEVVGIIGRNGAGKSTLLKVLSRITEPSEGRVEIRGRVASLLEVGTGFHSELSGRENIYLNGAILGMTRSEIRRKFDEIVAFSEVEQFLDTPVKRYSSGMYVRLAFAVAAHMEPEILIVDEVLAVGDAEFQQKCLGKMQDVAGEGRTVLFVSHNLSTINALCPRALLLEHGAVVSDGPSSITIEKFVTAIRKWGTEEQRTLSNSNCSLEVRDIIEHKDEFGCGKIELLLDISVPSPFEGAVNIFLKDEAARPVGACSLGGLGSASRVNFRSGSNVLRLNLSFPRLAEGSYLLDVELADKNKNRVAIFEGAAEIHGAPLPDEGCSEVLKQSWGFGSLWINGEML